MGGRSVPLFLSLDAAAGICHRENTVVQESSTVIGLLGMMGGNLAQRPCQTKKTRRQQHKRK